MQNRGKLKVPINSSLRSVANIFFMSFLIIPKIFSIGVRLGEYGGKNLNWILPSHSLLTSSGLWTGELSKIMYGLEILYSRIVFMRFLKKRRKESES